MLQDALRIWNEDRPVLFREAVGLAALCVTIVVGLELPADPRRGPARPRRAPERICLSA